MTSSQKYSWKAILIYFFLATSISLIFRTYTPGWLDFLKLPYGFGLNLLVGSGPLLSAICFRFLFKKEITVKKLPLFGTSVWKSTAFVVAPILVLTVIGIVNDKGLNMHVLGLKTGLLWLVYIYGEEFGWRGYLQQILPEKPFVNSFIIGITWYLWHLSFIFDGYNLSKELIFLLVLITGSYIALLITKRTQSLLTAVAFHISFSVMTNIPFTTGYLYGVIAMLMVWAVLLLFWKRPPLKPLNSRFI